MKRRNLVSALRGRAVADPMRDYDTLPPRLRQWLAVARLPWSPRSARRIWQRALEQGGGDPAQAIAALDRAEARSLLREARLSGARYGTPRDAAPR